MKFHGTSLSTGLTYCRAGELLHSLVEQQIFDVRLLKNVQHLALYQCVLKGGRERERICKMQVQYIASPD